MNLICENVRIFKHLDRGGGMRTEAEKQAELDFCSDLVEMFVSADERIENGVRGWCYLLEEHGLMKSDFNSMEAFITKARKDGRLPNNICTEDDNRLIVFSETLVPGSVGEYSDHIIDNVIPHYTDTYTPESAWENQTHFLMLAVEKKDLVQVFRPVCQKYRVPMVNLKGDADVHSRASMMLEFQRHHDAGRKPVLLYFGDHDPKGINIADKLLKNLNDVRNVWWSDSDDEINITRDDILFDHFGLSWDFVLKHNVSISENLMTAGGKDLSDPTHNDHNKPYVQDYLKEFGARKCEANALVTRQQAGRDLLEETILKYVCPGALGEHEKYLDEQRDALRTDMAKKLVDRFGGGVT